MNELGKTLPLWSIVPFAGLLLCIAVLPLVREHWWEHNKNKAIVATAFGLPPFVYFLYADYHVLIHTGLEYGQFIVLILSLFVVSGGIFISGDIRATPKVNTLFLIVGAVLANLVGTTGAAMLLIRPMLRTNSQRKNTRHIPVFFIFLVANIGGSLLPIGDPPLFLGFLKGVPFFWTLKLILPWLMTVGLVSAIFYVFDSIAYAGEKKEALEADQGDISPLKLHGRKNIPLLLAIVVAVGSVKSVHLPAHHWYEYVPWREIIMLLVVAISLTVTPMPGKTIERKSQLMRLKMMIGGVFLVAIAYSSTHAANWLQFAWPPLVFTALAYPSLRKIDRTCDPRTENKFTFFAVSEVAVLFAGIFAAMIPALLILQARGGDLPVREAWHFFMVTGSLSAFLDNAPTYLTFLSLAQGQHYTGADAIVGVAPAVLQGISLGAVFMGAMSYIGNAPNFMVKSITEETGLKMPSFGGYFMWAVLILLPVFALVNVVFLGLKLW